MLPAVIASQKKLCSLDATVLKENLVKLDEYARVTTTIIIG